MRCVPARSLCRARRLMRAQGYVPKTKTDHVAPDVPLARVKDRLSQVRGALVECPMVRSFLSVYARRGVADGVEQDFLIDEDGFATGPEWKGLNPTLPIYI